MAGGRRAILLAAAQARHLQARDVGVRALQHHLQRPFKAPVERAGNAQVGECVLSL